MMKINFKILKHVRKRNIENIRRKHTGDTNNNHHWETRVFSGIQPTGRVHIGNYLGAILNWVKIQNELSNVTFSIVDLHSITLPQDPKILKNDILEMAATLLACGINPEKSILFLQSAVPQHTELCWHLACLTTMARLSHLPQYKEKSAKLKEVPLGLFIYPVLQASDILIHKATHVPVGEDQVQHLQLTQHLAKIFNHKYGLTFPTPKAMIADDSSCRIRSLREPLKKMSKSEPDPKSRIHLNDSPDVILEKVKKAVTDFTSEVTYDPEERPGVSNLISIHSYFSGKTVDEICLEAQNSGLDTGKYKFVVADVIINYLKPIREKINSLLAKEDYLYEILEYGRTIASQRAEETLDEVNSKVGTKIFNSTNKLELIKNFKNKS